jgi:hypothetical protein
VQENLHRALGGYFYRGLLFFVVTLPPLVLIGGLKKGLIADDPRALHVFLLYYVGLAVVWLGWQVLRHRALPRAVRDHLWRGVHVPRWAGLRDTAVFCGIVASVFHGIYLYMWWGGGRHYAPATPFSWALFAAFSFWIVTCYLYLVGQWVRRRRPR